MCVMMSVNNNNNNNPKNPNRPQQSGGAGVAGQFQLSQYAAAHAHAQAIAQAQSKAQAQAHAQAQAQAHAHAQAAHAQFQAHLQAQGLSLNQPPAVLNSSSPGTGSVGAKRPPQKPLGRPPGSTTNANLLSPLRSMEVTPASRKKKQKLSDKQLPGRVAAILPQSALYSQLREFESHVDAALARKKIDIQDAIKNPLCFQKTLRIYVFNTFANQVRTIPKKPNAEPPSWTLKIVGRILEEEMDPDQAGVIQKSNPLYPKFSSFLKKVTITLDKRLYPDSHLIVWDSTRMPAPQEGFEVRRKGDKEFTVNIRLEMNYTPEKFKLSPVLMEALGFEVETRPRIIGEIWNYVKVRKLQNADDPTYFKCDLALQKVFGEETVKFTTVSQKISHHLSPPPPIHLEHRIKLSGNSPAGNACYDVLVDVPFTINRELNALLSGTEKSKEIEACDEGICSIIRKIQEHRKRRAFFLGFSQSPVEFIDALIESQGRDLNLLAGETSRNAEKERRSDFYNQPWVEDAVNSYVNRKPPPAAAPPSA